MTTCKKITLTAAAMVLSAGLAVGGTLAYLNAVTETKTNTFTSSRNITTTLTETEWTSDSGKNYLPGDVIKKNPVMNNESDQPVYMAVKVDYLDDKGNLMSAEEFKKYASITDYDNDNWKMATVNSDGSEVWIYMTAVEAGESTEALFNNVTVNAGITEEWSSAAKTTTIYKCDADGNKLSIIDTTKEQYDPTVIYKDADGNIVSAGTLPTFNIKVTVTGLKKGFYSVIEEESWTPEYTLIKKSDNYSGNDSYKECEDIFIGKRIDGTKPEFFGLDKLHYGNTADGDKAQADFSNVIKKNYNWLRDAASAVNKFIR